jgi:adenine C2-methylase RlmN of 23S rRNA A2503 and tRNA A37
MAVAKKLSNANTSKFQQILAASGQDLIERRSQLIYTGTNDAMQDHLTSLVRKRNAVELEILNLTDLSVKTRDSLSPGNKNFNPSEWLGQLLELKAEMALIEEDIALAEEVNEEYFVIPAAVV